MSHSSIAWHVVLFAAVSLSFATSNSRTATVTFEDGHTLRLGNWIFEYSIRIPTGEGHYYLSQKKMTELLISYQQIADSQKSYIESPKHHCKLQASQLVKLTYHWDKCKGEYSLKYVKRITLLLTNGETIEMCALEGSGKLLNIDTTYRVSEIEIKGEAATDTICSMKYETGYWFNDITKPTADCSNPKCTMTEIRFNANK